MSEAHDLFKPSEKKDRPSRAKALSEGQLLTMLREKYPRDAYAFFPHVPNATGGSKSRTADGLALSLWPSRGLDLHGFEIKSSRSDWLREKDDPSKADAIAKYCDFWWLVIGDESIVQGGELPTPWGLLVPRDGKLVVKKQALKLESQPLTRPFIAGLLRVAQDHVTDRAEVERQIEQAVEAAEQRWKARQDQDEGNWKHQYERLRETVGEFEEAAGIELHAYQGKSIGAAVRKVLDGDAAVAQVQRELRWKLEALDRIRASVVAAMELAGGAA